jgi:hypothetical protein
MSGSDDGLYVLFNFMCQYSFRSIYFFIMCISINSVYSLFGVLCSVLLFYCLTFDWLLIFNSALFSSVGFMILILCINDFIIWLSLNTFSFRIATIISLVYYLYRGVFYWRHTRILV